MYETRRALVLSAMLLLALVDIILLIVRADHVSDISFFYVTLPLNIAMGIGILVFFFLSVFGKSRTTHDRFFYMGLVFLLAGLLTSRLLLSSKFERATRISYLSCFLPAAIGILCAIFFVIAGLFAARSSKGTTVKVKKTKRKY